MLTKAELKYYSGLLQKKNRKSEKKFLVEGKRLCEEGLKSSYKCESIFYTEEFEKTEISFLTSHKLVPTEKLKAVEFSKISDTKNPQGIAACFNIPAIHNRFSSNIIVALEGISDPGNVGTILRTCDWFGIKEVILSGECAEIYNPKTLRASMGAIFYLNISTSENFIDELKILKSKNYKIITSDMNGKNFGDFSFPPKSIITFSNEANGPSEELQKISDEIITIPKFGNIESLNVASAAAVIISKLTQ